MSRSVKVLIVGGHLVGKTTLFCQLVRGQSFPRGSDSIKQSSEFILLNGNLHVEIHDCLVATPKSLITQTWRNINAIIYMFSYEDLKTLHDISFWSRHVKTLLFETQIHQIIVGNKIDLIKTSEVATYERTLQSIAKELDVRDCDIFKVTSTTGDGVDGVRERIGERFRDYHTSGPPETDYLRVIPHQTVSGCMCIN